MLLSQKSKTSRIVTPSEDMSWGKGACSYRLNKLQTDANPQHIDRLQTRSQNVKQCSNATQYWFFIVELLKADRGYHDNAHDSNKAKVHTAAHGIISSNTTKCHELLNHIYESG